MAELPTTFKEYIRIIGRGQRAGRTLTEEEAFAAMGMLIRKDCTPEQRGAFLMLLRVREETPEEIAGFVRAFRQHNLAGLDSLGIDLDMGCYAGKRRHLPWFILAALCLAQTGRKVFMHGTQEPESQRLYLDHVLPELGMPVASNLEQAKQALKSWNICYMPLSQVNPALEEVIQLRALFGLRSCANTLARMLNPSKAEHSLQGVFHKEVDNKHQHAAALLDEANALCFRGEGGELEINPERPATLCISRHGQLSTVEVPALLTTWQTKSKILDAGQLVDFWTGDDDSLYAQQAVVGTLAIMLVLTDKCEWLQAYEQAQRLWQQRNRQWPFSLDLAQHIDFSTTGIISPH